MSNEIAAFVITKVLGTQMSDDGRFLLIHIEQAIGGTAWLSIPVEAADGFAHAGAMGIAALEKHQPDNTPKRTFTATWWELEVAPTSGEVFLALTFGAGAKIRFHLPARCQSPY